MPGLGDARLGGAQLLGQLRLQFGLALGGFGLQPRLGLGQQRVCLFLGLGDRRLVARERGLGLAPQTLGLVQVGGDPVLARLEDLGKPRQGAPAEQVVEGHERHDQPEDLGREGGRIDLRHRSRPVRTRRRRRASRTAR